MVITLVKKSENDLFGVCSDIAEMFRERGLAVQVYPEPLDSMDVLDRTSVNLIIYGDVDDVGMFYRILDKLIDSGNRILSSGTCYHLNQTQSLDNYYLFDFCGKRIKIRDRT